MQDLGRAGAESRPSTAVFSSLRCPRGGPRSARGFGLCGQLLRSGAGGALGVVGGSRAVAKHRGGAPRASSTCAAGAETHKEIGDWEP